MIHSIETPQAQIPGALSQNPEALGTRIRLNKGHAPKTLWMLKIAEMDEDTSLEDVNCFVYLTRKEALASYREDLEEAAEEFAMEDEDPAGRIDLAVSELDRTGALCLDDEPRMLSVSLVETPIWGSRA